MLHSRSGAQLFSHGETSDVLLDFLLCDPSPRHPLVFLSIPQCRRRYRHELCEQILTERRGGKGRRIVSRLQRSRSQRARTDREPQAVKAERETSNPRPILLGRSHVRVKRARFGSGAEDSLLGTCPRGRGGGGYTYLAACPATHGSAQELFTVR